MSLSKVKPSVPKPFSTALVTLKWLALLRCIREFMTSIFLFVLVLVLFPYNKVSAHGMEVSNLGDLNDHIVFCTESTQVEGKYSKLALVYIKALPYFKYVEKREYNGALFSAGLPQWSVVVLDAKFNSKSALTARDVLNMSVGDFAAIAPYNISPVWLVEMIDSLDDDQSRLATCMSQRNPHNVNALFRLLMVLKGSFSTDESRFKLVYQNTHVRYKRSFAVSNIAREFKNGFN